MSLAVLFVESSSALGSWLEELVILGESVGQSPARDGEMKVHLSREKEWAQPLACWTQIRAFYFRQLLKGNKVLYDLAISYICGIEKMEGKERGDRDDRRFLGFLCSSE